MPRFRNQNADLDALDARILSALAADARRSIAELARIGGLSPPN
jgi:DNA-binding Lrp family transcriptional regulator